MKKTATPLKATENYALIETSKPWGVIRFIHSDGKNHEFYSVVNKLTGSRLTAFDDDPPGINDSIKWVKSVFRDIRIKAQILEYKGTEHFQ